MIKTKTIVVIVCLICISVMCVFCIGATNVVPNTNTSDIGLSKLAVSNEESIAYKYVSEDIAKEIVKSRVEVLYGEEVEITKCIPIFELNDELFGYQITFETDFYSDEMVVLDTYDLDLIIYQFTLYTRKDTNVYYSTNPNRSTSAGRVKKYIVSPFEICDYMGDGKVQLTNRVVSLDELRLKSNNSSVSTFSYTTNDSIVKDYTFDRDYKSWFGSGKSVSLNEKYITNARRFIPTDQNSLNYEVGNCGATAAFNILKYYQDCKGYNIFKGQYNTDVYKKLIEYMGKEEGTTIYQMAEGVTKYINKETNKSASFTHYVPPMWNYFKGDLDNNHPVLYAIWPSDGMHAMSAVGYLEVKENKTILPKKFKFLIVAPGWYPQLTYTNFDAIDLKLGCVIKVK